MKIGLALFPGLCQLDMTGPHEVMARYPGAELSVVAARMAPVTTDRGLTIRPDCKLWSAPAFDIFVMPSVTEGLGTSLLDAMACEKPIVASRVGGIPEVVLHRETGLLVRPTDVDQLADAIVRLLRDRELAARLAATGLARVRERFTVERMVEATLAVYERLAGSVPEAGTRGRAWPS